jgi:hypothetical protein
MKWNGAAQNEMEHKFLSIVWTFYKVLYCIPSHTPQIGGKEK